MAAPQIEQPSPAGAALRPPETSLGPAGWIRQNLFSNWPSGLLTLVSLLLLYKLGGGLLRWVLVTAQWQVVTKNLRIFFVGAYPAEHLWRLWLMLGLAVLLGALTWAAWTGLAGGSISRRRGWLLGAWAVFPIVALLLIGGSSLIPGLAKVPSTYWNGFLLNLLLAAGGILFCFPLGALLALGRQSNLPAIRLVCIGYIELIRAVPLVTVLFMAMLVVPLFMPEQVRIDNVTRAFIGITLFSAAYMAENIRGGLQAVPKGQMEAAKALGLPGWQTVLFIQLPQAIRLVIPAIVGQFIGLFKDTSLVYIVSQMDLMGAGSAVLAQREFMGRHLEVYAFAALIFFLACYTLSHVSRRLERALGVGQR